MAMPDGDEGDESEVVEARSPANNMAQKALGTEELAATPITLGVVVVLGAVLSGGLSGAGWWLWSRLDSSQKDIAQQIQTIRETLSSQGGQIEIIKQLSLKATNPHASAAREREHATVPEAPAKRGQKKE
jgi:hypothetical protein